MYRRSAEGWISLRRVSLLSGRAVRPADSRRSRPAARSSGVVFAVVHDSSHVNQRSSSSSCGARVRGLRPVSHCRKRTIDCGLLQSRTTSTPVSAGARGIARGNVCKMRGSLDGAIYTDNGGTRSIPCVRRNACCSSARNRGRGPTRFTRLTDLDPFVPDDEPLGGLQPRIVQHIHPQRSSLPLCRSAIPRTPRRRIDG